MRKTFLCLLSLATFLLQISPVQATGSGFFSHSINWANSGNLKYYVFGGPASTCGDLWTYRNGGPWILEAAGWLCTDGNGFAEKGPWSWANQANDETAYAYIKWPNTTQTTTDQHIWDKTCANAEETVSGSPPLSFSGTATDTAWGAGFDATWTECRVSYFDLDDGYFWDPSSGDYDLATDPEIGCDVSGMPGFSVTWNAPDFPASGDHISGHCYLWTIEKVTDGYCSDQDSHYFCFP